jgi:hypothetical protein
MTNLLRPLPLDDLFDFVRLCITEHAPVRLPSIWDIEIRHERSMYPRGGYPSASTIFRSEPVYLSVRMGSRWHVAGVGSTEEEAAAHAVIGLAMRQGIGLRPLLAVLAGAPEA